MTKNMGSADKIIRIIIAVAFITLYLTGLVTGILGMLLIVLSLIFLATSFIGTCPLYLPFGLCTLRKLKK